LGHFLVLKLDIGATFRYCFPKAALYRVGLDDG